MMRSHMVALLLMMSVVLQSAPLVAGQATEALHPVADYYADSKFPKSAYGKTSFLYVGNSYDHEQNIWGSERIYVRFDISVLPRGYVVVQATLRLWQYYAPTSEQTYEAHRVLGDWNERTQNWENQPSWAEANTSETIAPARKEVAVEWNITNDVSAWYNGKVPNYGTMIKVGKEGHVRDASSGFWSREYPVEEWKPRLIVVLRGDPALKNVVTLAVAGLPAGVASAVSVDGQPYSQILLDVGEEIAFDKGTVHTIAVSPLLVPSPGARYRCEVNQIQVSASTSYVFIYTAEYQVTFSILPSGMFPTPPTQWYRGGAALTINRTGPDLINTAPGIRLVFDGWYINSHKLTVEPNTIVVNESITVEGRYTTEYYLNVTSSIGETEGSGWYAVDSVASFSVDKRAVPAEGFLGILGLRRSFTRWIGSNNFLGLPAEPQGSVIMKAPTAIEAVWQDDWSPLILNIAVVLLGVVALCGAAIVTSRKRHHLIATERDRFAE
jgi:hypothetical protein